MIQIQNLLKHVLGCQIDIVEICETPCILLAMLIPVAISFNFLSTFAVKNGIPSIVKI